MSNETQTNPPNQRPDRDPLARAKSEPNLDYSPREADRYSRHILIPEMGVKGQARLRESKIFVVGAGGLGSPLLLYLVSAGVGHVAWCDADKVDLSNLQRQVLHSTDDLGKPKVESAEATLKALNPLVELVPHNERLCAANIDSLIGSSYDAVLDGSDNFATRFMVNDYCWFNRIPLVSAAVQRFEGQLSVFTQEEDSPCYRCFFPAPPPAGTVPTCTEAGVLGSVVGVMGTLQATETLKLLSGAGTLLIGKLMRYDALRGEFMNFKMKRDPTCPLCGESPSVTGVEDPVIEECRID